MKINYLTLIYIKLKKEIIYKNKLVFRGEIQGFQE